MRTAKRLLILVLVLAMTMVALPALAGVRTLSTSLSGANEVPPNASEATGFAKVAFDQSGTVCVSIRSGGYLAGDGDVVAGHIHVGPAGVNGPVVVGLDVTSANHRICVEGVDLALIDDIRNNPSNYYINIHTATIPSGEIRGQLG